MKYFVNRNAQSTGEHEVHTEDCIYKMSGNNMMYLGEFTLPSEAIKEAKKYFNNVDGCFYCLKNYHNR